MAAMIENDHEVHPSSLRFEVGNVVLCKWGHGWFEALVIQVCQRLCFGGASQSKFIPYVVTVDGINDSFIEGDTDDWIRRFPEDRTPDPENFQPFLVPPEDPYAFLYTGVTNVPYDSKGANMAKEAEKLESVDKARLLPNGTIELSFKGGSEKVITATVPIPQEPLYGVPGIMAFQCGQNIHLRRIAGTGPDFIELFKSVVPKESSLKNLEKASKKSNAKMLSLADALLFGVHGWPRDIQRASSCYQAAAWGCSEEEMPARAGFPVGSPEAMVASAHTILAHMKKEIMGKQITEKVPWGQVLAYALQTQGERELALIENALFWLTRSVFFGWVTPLTLDFAIQIKNMKLIAHPKVDENMKDMIKILLKVEEYRQLEVEHEDRTKKYRGDPTKATIDLFRPKAYDIFSELPTRRDIVHLEYRQIPRAPFTLAFYAIVASRKEVLKVVRLPDSLQIASFSQESFEEFASFLKNTINGSGTEVRLVPHDTSIIFKSRGGRRRRNPRQSASLGEVITELESQLLEVQGLLYDAQSAIVSVVSSAQQESVRQQAGRLIASTGNDREPIMWQAGQLKEEGNGLFTSREYDGAIIRCYSVAISLLNQLADHDFDTYKLLGTLLSNRAGGFLEIESRRIDTEFRKLIVQSAITDCTVALESSWASTALPPIIKEKLKFRRDKATARLSALAYAILESAYPEPSLESTSVYEAVGENDVTRHGTQELGGDGERAPSMPRRFRGTGEATLDGATQKTEPDPQDSPFSYSYDTQDGALMEYGKVVYDNDLAKNARDGCPVCLEDFSAGLSQKISTVLPCGEHALCVECVCRLKKQSDKARTALECPLCRTSVDSESVQDLAYQIIVFDEELAMATKKLPVDDPHEHRNIAQRLLWTHDFRVDAVIEVLECMLDDQLSGLFFRAESDWTHEQKQEIYRGARRKVEMLLDKVKVLETEKLKTYETSRLAKLDKDIVNLRSELKTARLNARDEIYEQLNSVGTMGAQRSVGGRDLIQIDFHGLHVDEMHRKFDEQVKPILPVVKKVRVITGRGSHSSGGESKLKKALVKWIEKKETGIRWENIASNPGALDVVWVPER